MSTSVPPNIPREPLVKALIALGDDELVLGHRNSEWTGHSPILEEDIAFSNIAQDELGHSLALFTLQADLTGTTPDQLAFDRAWDRFTCCRFVTNPKGDFAYTVVRQYLFDEAEQVRMQSLLKSSFKPLRGLAEKILAEEAYHLLHTKSLVERLGDATEESHRRMQEAVTTALPQSLGMFEEFEDEAQLVDAGALEPSKDLCKEWLQGIASTLTESTLILPAVKKGGAWTVTCASDDGGRRGHQTEHLKHLVKDLQLVYQIAPGPGW